MNQKILIGKNHLSGRNIYLPLSEFQSHIHVLGRTGQGKSKFLEHLAREIIQNKNSLILIDGKGDLYDSMVKFCTRRRLENRTILIDPHQTEYSVGINYLELFGKTNPEELAEMILEGLKKIFGEDEQYQPWFERWALASLVPLIKTGGTLIDLVEFSSLADSRFRDKILKELDDDFYSKEWRELEIFKKLEQATMINVLRTRAGKIFSSLPLRYILGQKKTTINWQKVMSEGGIILADLSRRSPLTEKTASVLGIAILHQIIQNAYQRPKEKRRSCYLMVDEFQKFACNDFADALETLRGLGVYLILSNQELQQLKDESERLYSSVMANTRIKITFSISRQDALEMAEELFTGYIRTDEIKDILWQTKFYPKETTREIVSIGTSRTTSESRGWQTTFTEGIGTTTSLSPEGDVLITTTSSQESFSQGESFSHSESLGETETISKVPWYEYEPFQEISSRTYFSIDEIKEKYRAWITRQDPRHAQLKIGSRKPIPILTPFIEEVRVREKDVEKLKQIVYNKYAKPIDIVRKEIEQRKVEEIEEPQNYQAEEIKKLKNFPGDNL